MVNEKSLLEHDQGWPRHAICCQPEVAGAVISGGDVKTIDCYVVINGFKLLAQVFSRI